MTKNVSVLDEFGRWKGTTYAKRAKSLVKNGRAKYVNDCTILLFTDASSDQTLMLSEDYHMNYIYFNAKDWALNKEVNSIGERSFIQDFNNELSEVFQLGDWSYEHHYCEINSPAYALEANTPYTFVFWLNGGENDRNDEICRLEVVTDGDEEKKSAYKLNRGFIKPVLKYRGWELYAISFITPQSEETVSTVLRFVAVNAPMAVMAAKELETYLNWPEEKDPFEAFRPQRHNIVFEDGWPADAWYATETLAEVHAEIPYSTGGKKPTIDEQIQNFANDFGKELNQFMAEFAQGAKSFAGTVKRKAKDFKDSGYQDKVTQKTKDVASQVKHYGSAVGSQVEDMVSEMMTAENQEKMQDVIKKAEDALKDAVAAGDKARIKIMNKVKKSLQNYRDAKKEAEEEMQEELDEIIAEQIEELEDQLNDVEDEISDLEDEIADKMDAADDIDDEVADLNEELKEATEEEKKGILAMIKEKISEKDGILDNLEQSKTIVMKELRERRDDLAKMLHDLKSEKPEEKTEEETETGSIEIEGEDE